MHGALPFKRVINKNEQLSSEAFCVLADGRRARE